MQEYKEGEPSFESAPGPESERPSGEQGEQSAEQNEAIESIAAQAKEADFFSGQPLGDRLKEEARVSARDDQGASFAIAMPVLREIVGRVTSERATATTMTVEKGNLVSWRAVQIIDRVLGAGGLAKNSRAGEIEGMMDRSTGEHGYLPQEPKESIPIASSSSRAREEIGITLKSLRPGKGGNPRVRVAYGYRQR